MAKVGTAEYDVEISRAAVQREVDATSRQIERGLGSSAAKVKQEFGSAAAGAVAGFGLYKGIQAIGDAVGAASDLAEQQTKVGVVFGDSSESVAGFAENAEQALGQSERAALEAAGTFGNLFRSVGLAEEQSASMSTTLTALGSDLASFNNTSVDDALTAIRSGLVGETEPLKRFGVNLNEATLKAKALELGLGDGVAQLDASAKAQAAYAIIMDQTTLAQGDFARTADGLANKQRILSAEWENAQAKLGEELIPAASVGVDVLSSMLAVVTALPGPVVAVGLAVGATTVAFGLLAPVVRTGWAELGAFVGAESATAASSEVATVAITSQTAGTSSLTAATAVNTAGATANTAATGGMRAAWLAAGGASGVLTKGLIGAAAGIAAYNVTYGILEDNSEFKFDTDSVEELTAALHELSTGGASTADVLADFGGASGLADLVDDAANASDELDRLAATGPIKAMEQALIALYAVNPDAALKAYGEVSAAITAQGGDTQDLVALMPEFTQEVTDNAYAQRLAAGATTAAADASGDRAKALQDEFDALKEVHDAERGASDAKEELIHAFDELNTANAEARGESEEYRQSLRDIEAANEDAADAAKDSQRAHEGLARAQGDLTDAQNELTDARKRAAETLQDLQFAAEGAVLSRERAQLRLEAAIENEKAVLDSAVSTDRERREATLSRKEAELALREATDSQGDSAEELGGFSVEGSPEVIAAQQRIADAKQGVVDAQERVTDAIDAQRDAENEVTLAIAANKQVIVDAKGEVEEATDNLRDAALEEADAQAELAGLTGDAAAANQAYIDSLEDSAAAMDPESPMRKNLQDYIDDLKELNELLGLEENPRTGPPRPDGSIPGKPDYPTGPPSPNGTVPVIGGDEAPVIPDGENLGRGRGGNVTQIFNGTGMDEKALATRAGREASNALMGF